MDFRLISVLSVQIFARYITDFRLKSLSVKVVAGEKHAKGAFFILIKKHKRTIAHAIAMF